MRLKQKSPFLRSKKKRAFTIWASRFTSFTTKKIFGKTLQAGLLTGGSSYLLRLPLAKRQRVALATFVTDYSGGTVPFTPVKYSETTDFHRLHRKNLRNQCNLRLLFKLESGFPLSPDKYRNTCMLLFDFTFILHSQSFQNKSIYKSMQG